MRHERTADGSGRLHGVDVLRGVAIIWVVAFHLWSDLEFFPAAPWEYYEALGGELRAPNDAASLLTAFTDLLLRLGFLGVPLFMMLSGVSLTAGAVSAPRSIDWRRFVVRRVHRLLLPYWAGVAITWAVIAAIAWRRADLAGTPFASEFSAGVTIAKIGWVPVDWGQFIASVTLAPRLYSQEWFFAPQLALWFVALLGQYYLLFPLLLFAMRRIGVLPLLVLSFMLTAGANAWVVHEYRAPEVKFWLVTGLAPFRLFEFTFGMALGWLVASPDARRWLSSARRLAPGAIVVAAGLSAFIAGGMMTGRLAAGYGQALALPLGTLGMGLLALPLVVKPASRVDRTIPLRALMFVGVMSYTVLIVNDALRLVASQLRVEGLDGGAWWWFVFGVYFPASLLLSWPLARILGLLPQRPSREAPRTPVEEALSGAVPVLASRGD